jgi:Fic family protein
MGIAWAVVGLRIHEPAQDLEGWSVHSQPLGHQPTYSNTPLRGAWTLNQPILHNWHPIEDLPAGYEAMASTELRALSEVWLEQRESLQDSTSLRAFNERLQRQWAIETGVIERVYSLDRGITELLIERGIDSSLIPDDATDKDPNLVAGIIQDQESAIEWVFEVVRGERPLSTSFIKELHALMTRRQTTTRGKDQFGNEVDVPLLHGEWKRLPNNPTRMNGSVHEYCPPEQVAIEMDRLIEMHNKHEIMAVPPEIEAAWLHHRFTQIHPFQDGNGRVARALASLVFIKAGWFPLVVTRDDRVRYIEALEEADQSALTSLVSLFSSLERKAFVNALGIAREVLREEERIEQVISSIGDLFAARDEALRREWERAKEVAERLADTAREKLESIAIRLQQEVEKYAVPHRFFVDSELNTGQRKNWYRWQTIEAAHQLEYFANTTEYNAWVRLGLITDTEANIVLSFTAIGREYRGLIGASLYFFRTEEVEEGQRQAVDVTVASDEVFQINYKEEESSVTDRFELWLDRGMTRGLEVWRRGL